MGRFDSICKLPSPFEAVTLSASPAASGGSESSDYKDLAFLPDQQGSRRPALKGGGTAHGGGGCPALPALVGEPPPRKIGRPIAFTGDPNSKDLNEADRRRIKRRIANRESARRVRQKRLEVACGMQDRLEAARQRVVALTAQLEQSEAHRAALVQKAADTRGELLAAEAARSPRRTLAPAAPMSTLSPVMPSQVMSLPLRDTPPAPALLESYDIPTLRAPQAPSGDDTYSHSARGGHSTVTSGTTAAAAAATAASASACGVRTGALAAESTHVTAPGRGSCSRLPPFVTVPPSAASVSVTPAANTVRLCSAAPAMVNSEAPTQQVHDPYWGALPPPPPELSMIEAMPSTDNPLDWFMTKPLLGMEALLPLGGF